jgi:hypothetical protein
MISHASGMAQSLQGGSRGYLPERIIRIMALEEAFDPAESVTWDIVMSPWFFPRHWGRYS